MHVPKELCIGMLTAALFVRGKTGDNLSVLEHGTDKLLDSYSGMLYSSENDGEILESTWK